MRLGKYSDVKAWFDLYDFAMEAENIGSGHSQSLSVRAFCLRSGCYVFMVFEIQTKIIGRMLELDTGRHYDVLMVGDSYQILYQ